MALRTTVARDFEHAIERTSAVSHEAAWFPIFSELTLSDDKMGNLTL
jgi:hypothetical protein